MLLIALIMLISLLPILLHQEQVRVKPTGKATPIWRDLGDFFGRRELWLCRKKLKKQSKPVII